MEEVKHHFLNKKTLILIFVIFAVMVFGFLSNFVFSPPVTTSPKDFLKSQLPVGSSVSPTEGSIKSDVSHTQPPLNFVVYDTSSYQISYPSQWKVQTTVSDAGNSITRIIAPYANENGSYLPGFDVELSSQSVNTIVDSKVKSLSSLKTLEKSASVIANTQATKLVATAPLDSVLTNGGLAKSIKRTYLIFGRNSNTYIISYSYSDAGEVNYYEGLFQRMLSSIKLK